MNLTTHTAYVLNGYFGNVGKLFIVKDVKDLSTTTPTVTGTVKVGHTVEAHHGSWTAGTKFTYQWYAAGKKVSGATSYKLKLSSHVKGTAVYVRIEGTLAGYSPSTLNSAATTTVK